MSLTPEKCDKLNALDLNQIENILQSCVNNNEVDSFMSSPKAYIESHGYTFPFTYDYYDGIKRSEPEILVDAIGNAIIWPRPITPDGWTVCKECNIRYLCGGGCVALLQNNEVKPIINYCKVFRYIAEERLNSYFFIEGLIGKNNISSISKTQLSSLTSKKGK